MKCKLSSNFSFLFLTGSATFILFLGSFYYYYYIYIYIYLDRYYLLGSYHIFILQILVYNYYFFQLKKQQFS